MANKRDTSRQRRARENRARRAALEARTSGSAPAAPSRVAPSTAQKVAKAKAEDRPAPRDAATSADEGTGAEAAGAGRKKRTRPPRPGDRPVDVATLEGNFVTKVTKVPGGTQVLMAAGLTIAVTLMMSFLDFYVPAAEKGDPDATPSLTIFEAEGTGRALVVLGIPVVVVGLALAFSLHAQRRRIWLGATLLIGVLYGPTVITYLFVVGFLGYAVLRARKVEGPLEPMLVGWLNRRSERRKGSAEPGDPARDQAVDSTAEPVDD